MIIKSMARKVPTFTQLAAYIGRDATPGAVFARNLYHAGHDAALVARQFEANHRYLPKRKNGNALYHEVIVLEPQPGVGRERLNAALLDLAERYCAVRAPDQLAWGRVHQDTDYPHIHLMLSSNAVRSGKRVRLAKPAFAKVQRDLESYREQAYPELAGGIVYRRQEPSQNIQRTRAEGEMVRRSGTKSRKQAVRDELAAILKQACGKREIDRALGKAGYERYRRGKSDGVIHRASGTRYRLRRLGLEKTLKEALERQRPAPQPPVRRAPAAVLHMPKIPKVVTGWKGREAIQSRPAVNSHIPAPKPARAMDQAGRATTQVAAGIKASKAQKPEPEKRAPKAVRRAAPKTKPVPAMLPAREAPVLSTRPSPPKRPSPASKRSASAPPKPVRPETPAPDPREAALLKRRSALEQAARQRLDGFDHDNDGRER